MTRMGRGTLSSAFADLASLFPQNASLRVAPMLGDDGVGNLALLLEDPHVDIAFVSTDALAVARANAASPDTAARTRGSICPRSAVVR